MKTPLQKLREKSKVTIQQVADAVGCSNANYCRIEQGIQAPRKKINVRNYKFFDKGISETEILFPENFMVEDDFQDLERKKAL